MARTWKVCSPTLMSASPNGERHSSGSPDCTSAKVTPSRAHSKTTPASFAEKLNVAVLLVVVASGPETIVVTGGPASTVQLHSAGDSEATPSGCTARTRSTCSPSVSPWTTCGEAQTTNGPSSLSSAHSKVAPGVLEEKVKVASVAAVGTSGSGPESTV